MGSGVEIHLGGLVIDIIRDAADLVELSRLFIFTVPLALVEFAEKKRSVLLLDEVPFLKKNFWIRPGWLVTTAV